MHAFFFSLSFSLARLIQSTKCGVQIWRMVFSMLQQYTSSYGVRSTKYNVPPRQVVRFTSTQSDSRSLVLLSPSISDFPTEYTP